MAAGPVAVTGTTAPRQVAACDTLVRLLPTSLGGRAARPVSDPSTAAWGSPAITLRCGVPAGSTRDEPYVFDGVRWVVHDDGAANRWTTYGRATEVQVVVPDAYDGQAELLIALSPALTAVR